MAASFGSEVDVVAGAGVAEAIVRQTEVPGGHATSRARAWCAADGGGAALGRVDDCEVSIATDERLEDWFGLSGYSTRLARKLKTPLRAWLS